MDLEELRSVREQERRTDSLQHLRDSFYDDAVDYVRDLKRERSRRAKAAGDPYAEAAMRLTDEIDTAEEVIESLYERRRGKVVKLASFAAAGMPAETDGMTDQEREMFADVVDRIEANEASVLGRLEPDADETPAPDPGAAGAPASNPAEAPDPAPATADTGDAEPPVLGGEPTADAPATGDTAEPASADEPPAATVGDTPEAPEPASAESTTPADDGGVLADAMGGPTESSDDTSPSTDAGPSPSEGDVTAADPAVDAGDPPGDGTDRPAAEAAAAAGSPETPPGEGVSTDVAAADRTETATPTASGPDADPATPAAGGAGAGTDTPRPDGAAPDTPETADGSGAGAAGTGTASTGTTPDDTERATVRVTRDVGEVFGVDDRAYDLRASDVVCLPRAVAEPLVARDAAELL